MKSASRFTLHAARHVVIGLLAVGCSWVTDGGDAPVLDVIIGDEVIGSVDASSWCRRTAFGTNACVAADGPVAGFDVECEADVHFGPRGQGWRLLESNVLVEASGGRWSIAAAEGDVLIDMDAPRVEASWFFTIRRADC